MNLSKNKNKLDAYEVPGEPGSLQGIPNQKISFSSLVRIYKNYSINTGLIWSGVKYGITTIDANNESVIGTFNPVLTIHISVKAEDIFIKGLSGTLGVYNLLDEHPVYLQPYKGSHSALPGSSREITIGISYKFSYKKTPK